MGSREGCRLCCRMGCSWWAPTGPVTRRRVQAVVRLAADDPRNRLDVEAHLRAVLPPGLAGEDVVAALSDRCQGVWVYLRYAVEELRSGVRGVRDLATLPSGLSRYYTDTVDRWSRGAEWDAGLLRVLGVVAVAGESLDAAELALAADADEMSPIDAADPPTVFCGRALRARGVHTGTC